MRKIHVTVSLLLSASMVACASTNASSGAGRASSPWPAYLSKAHSHNDYVQGRPLLDAVERGFASVEVDVVLRDGELYVAHAPEEVRSSSTLSRLYLDPLRDLARQRAGWIYAPSDPPLQLLIDVKSPADETYRALDERLTAYSDILTTWTLDRPAQGPVTVVLSGNRAMRLAMADTVRYVALDGRVEEDRSTFSTDAMPLVSVDWEKIEPSGGDQRLARAQQLIELVHAEGRKIRFWGTPDREGVWRSLIAIGADYIGTDDTERLQRVLRTQ